MVQKIAGIPVAVAIFMASVCALVLAGCGYIVVPGDDSSPTPVATAKKMKVTSVCFFSAARSAPDTANTAMPT